MKRNVYAIVLICFAAAVLAVDIVFAIMTGLNIAPIKAGLVFTPEWFEPFCIAVLVLNPVAVVGAVVLPFVSKK